MRGLFHLRRSQHNLERTGHTAAPGHGKTPPAAETHHITSKKQQNTHQWKGNRREMYHKEKWSSDQHTGS
jgi:hypothetical protein